MNLEKAGYPVIPIGHSRPVPLSTEADSRYSTSDTRVGRYGWIATALIVPTLACFGFDNRAGLGVRGGKLGTNEEALLCKFLMANDCRNTRGVCLGPKEFDANQASFGQGLVAIETDTIIRDVVECHAEIFRLATIEARDEQRARTMVPNSRSTIVAHV